MFHRVPQIMRQCLLGVLALAVFPLMAEAAGILSTGLRQGEDTISDFLDRQLLLDGAGLERDLGHAVDDATGLVLGEGGGAFLPEVEQALGAVFAHAGEDAGDGVGSGSAAHRGDRIRRWSK